MSLGRQVFFWISALVVFILFLFVFRTILLPFVAGTILAYLFNPVAGRIERLGFNRLVATLILLGGFLLIVVVGMILLMPVLSHQVGGFVSNLPGYVTQLQRWVVTTFQGSRLGSVFGTSLQDLQTSLGSVTSDAASWLAGIVGSVWSGSQTIISSAALVVLTPVIAFYLLLDWDRMTAQVDGWLPRDHAPTIRRLLAEINAGVSGYIRGQVSVCLILGVYYAVGLTLVGLNFGILIGIMIGVISFIPYVGATVGLVTAVGVAVAQFWPEYASIGYVIVVFVIGQFLEGNILQPKLVGEHVGLHPVWLIFALFAFGTLFGFVGMLVAVPASAAVGVLARFALQRYLESPLYRGTRNGNGSGAS